MPVAMMLEGPRSVYNAPGMQMQFLGPNVSLLGPQRATLLGGHLGGITDTISANPLMSIAALAAAVFGYNWYQKKNGKKGLFGLSGSRRRKRR